MRQCNHRNERNDTRPSPSRSQLKERTRIEKAGGQVIFLGVWRVMGVLATSRALGDYPLKKDAKLVIPDPDVLIFDLRDFKPTFLCLASDGLWDAFTNDDAKNFIQDHITDDDFGVRAITREALSRGSTDNITVMIIKIPSLPPTSPDAKKIRFLNPQVRLRRRREFFSLRLRRFKVCYIPKLGRVLRDLENSLPSHSEDGADPKEKVGQAETGPKEKVGPPAADPKERVGQVEADSKEKVGQADSKEKVVDAEADREEKVGQGGDGGSKEGESPAADPKEGKSDDPKEGARHEEIRKLEELPSESASENEAAL
ncbi:unnamed protein product [Cyprideis torosa]|uniref:PPM-type phosphatase domain-containing protein n=1 Tax=Cyprideis torosa TaxID=163714 RepID=A0A7R8WL27_9CRUS|nr:unnamed protein product [Cyprideis torosa]CAG0903860.1 unnamed protein product [Cyprideis torosa]